MKQLTRKRGFPQRMFTFTKQTPFFRRRVDSKYWRSPVTTTLVRKDLLEFGNITTEPDSELLKCAINKARQAFTLPEKVKMLHLNDVFKQDLDIWNKSPGLPWKLQGYSTKGDIRDSEQAIQSIRKFWHLIKLGKKVEPTDCCAYVRSHIAEKPKTKVRAVWGYPATISFGEAMFAVPLIRAYQKGGFPIAYGYETALGGAKKLSNKFHRSHHFYAFDFKSFDKTVPTWLIEKCFLILATNIDFINYSDYGIADSDKNYLMFNYIRDYFINTPVRMSNGERYLKNSGVASGSYFTQLIDSIANYILITWLCYEQDIIPDLLVLGDDSIMGTSRPLDMRKFYDGIRQVHMYINENKSMYSTNVNDLTFLGYKINYGHPEKELESWIAALLFPERPDNTFDDYASRALGLFYANMGVNQAFDELTRDIINHPFEIRLNRNMERMLKMIGYKVLPATLPSNIDWLKRLGF